MTTDNNALQWIVMRYREHLRVLDEGPATVAEFSKSPYFVECRKACPPWCWDDHQMRMDQAALARAFVVDEMTWKERYIEAMKQLGFNEKGLQ